MAKRTTLQISIVVVSILIAAYWSGETSVSPAVKESFDSSTNDVTRSLKSEVSNETATDRTSSSPTKIRDCLNPAQIETHPMYSAEYGRIDSVVTTGPTIASYRGLTASVLEGLAVQGDSAAMAVLGAVSMMRARKLPEEKAVPYLLMEEPGLSSFGFKRPLDPEVEMHFHEASDWFYKSALHGRVMALYRIGEIYWTVKGGPVQIGWIDEGTYDALSSRDKMSIDPMNVYNSLAYEIAPQLRAGLFESLDEIIPKSERQTALLVELHLEFENDREKAGLPPINVAGSTAPTFEEIQSMLCDEYQHSNQNSGR